MSPISKRILSLLIILTFMLSTVSTAFAASPPDVPKGPDLNLINKWIDKKLATVQYNGNFSKDEVLKRIDFFTYINKVFNYIDKGNASFSDVIKDTSAANEIGKATAAGYLQADKNGKVTPFSPITRQDAAVILAKVFELQAVNPNAVEDYNDADKISDFARNAVSVMKEKGYIESREDGNFAPFGTMTRLQAIKMIDKVMGELANKAGTYSSNIAGNMVISTGNVTLKSITVSGDLYLTPGIGSGDVTLDGVTVKGRTFINGGGEKSVVIKNSNLLGNVTVNKNDGKVRVAAEGSTSIPNIHILSGATLEGNNTTSGGFGTVRLLEGIPAEQTVILKGKVSTVSAEANNVMVQTSANITNFEVKATANNSNINILDGTINQISILSDMASIDLKKGIITKMDIQGDANASKITVEGTANIGSLNANGNVSIGVLGGSVSNLNINSGATGSNLNIAYGGTVNSLSASGSVTVKGQGKVLSANVNTANVTFERKPEVFVLSPGVTTSIAGLETEVSTPTTVGSLSMNLTSATVGANQSIILTYTQGDILNNATVVFNIPTGFSVNTGDTLKIGAANTINLTSSQISGQKVTVTGVNLYPEYPSITVNGQVTYYTVNQSIILTLVRKLIPAANTYIFSATSDVDGPGARPATPGTGNEQKTFTANPPGATRPGSLAVVSNSTIAGQTGRTITLTYTAGEALNSGTVTFTLPANAANEINADITNDTYTLPTGATLPLLQTQINGQVITITGVNATAGQTVVLTLNGKTIPAPGTYNFSVTADADGPGLMTVSAGTGTEANTFASTDQTAPTVTVAAQTVTDGAGQTVNVSSSEASGWVYLLKADIVPTNINVFTNAKDAKTCSVGEVTAANTNVAISTTGLVNGDYVAYAVDSVNNISAPSVNIVTIGDGTAPTVTVAANQTAYDLVKTGKSNTLNVRSSDGSGSVYIVLEGENQSSIADLEASVTNGKGAKGSVVSANTDVQVSTLNLAAGKYYAYAVDSAIPNPNISAKSTNYLTVVAVDTVAPTVQVVTVNADVTNTSGQTVTLKSNEATGKVYIILSGETQATEADFDAAVAAHKGATSNVSTVGGDVVVSTSGLVAGNYNAYAVDGAGNISAAVTGQIKVSDGTSPVITQQSGATVDSNITLTYPVTTFTRWASKITAVKVDNTVLIKTTEYNIDTDGQITLIMNTTRKLLQKPGVKVITVLATDYAPVTVNQTISNGIANNLVIEMQPVAPLTLGTSFQTQPTLKLTDVYGNDCVTDNTTGIYASKSGGTGNWTLGGTGTDSAHKIIAKNGKFTFTNLTATRDDKVTDAEITFTADNLVPVISMKFDLQAPTGNEITTIDSLDVSGKTINPLTSNLYLNLDVIKISGTVTNTNTDLKAVKVRIKQNSSGTSGYYLMSENNGLFKSSTKVDLTATVDLTGTSPFDWHIDLTGVSFTDDTYTIEVIANDGADGVISTYSFIVKKTPCTGFNINEQYANRIMPNGGIVTLEALNGPITDASWTNILNQIKAKTTQDINNMQTAWIKDILPSSLDIIPIEGNTKAQLINKDKSNIASIVDNFKILAANGDTLDYAGNKAGDITIYSLISSSPSLDSAVTTTDGKYIEIMFNKPMNDPSSPYIDPKCFMVTKDGVEDTVKALTLKTNNSSVIVLELDTVLTNSQILMLSYSQGVIRSTDNGILKNFSGQQVSNKVSGPPILLTAETTIDGKQIQLTFSKDIDAASLGDPTHFIVNTGVADLVSGIALKTASPKNIVMLSLQKAITSIQTITVAYSPGTVKDADGYALAAVAPRAVVNNVVGPPDFYSASTTLDGYKIEVTFTKAILDPNSDPQNPKAYYNFFAINCNGAPRLAQTATMKGNDPGTVVLAFTQQFKYGDVIVIAYTQGNVVSSDGGILGSFTAKKVNNTVKQPPKLLLAETSTNGDTISLKFDMLMGDTSGNITDNKNKLIVMTSSTDSILDATDIPASSIALDTNQNTIVLSMQPLLTYKQYIWVKYIAGGDLKSRDGGYLAVFEPVKVTNLVTRPPEISTITTNDDGKQIIVKFSKVMEVPAVADYNSFYIKVGNSRDIITGMSFKTSPTTDKTSLIFMLTDPILNGQAVTLTYTPGDVKAGDGIALEVITDPITATNIVMPPPTLNGATTTPEGTKIELAFDKVMGIPSDLTQAKLDIAIKVNGVADEVTNIGFKTGDNKTLVLTLKTTVQSGQAIAMVYGGTSIRSGDNGILAAITLLDPKSTVANSVVQPPVLSPAVTSVDGGTIELTFDKEIAALPSKSESNFTVTANTVMSVALKQSDNNKTIILILKTPILDTQTGLKVAYVPGTVKAADGGILAAFTGDVQNKVVGPPTFESATTTTDGSTIEVTFSKSLSVPDASEKNNFKVVSGTANTVFSISFKTANNVVNDKVIVLTMTTPIAVGKATTVAYSGGTVASTLGRLLASFTAQTVANTVVPQPKCTSATATSDGSSIELKFDNSMADPQAQPLGSFVVLVDGVQDDLASNSNIVLKPTTTDTFVLTLSKAIIFGNIVTVGYNTGTIKGTAASTKGSALQQFSGIKVTNLVIAAPTYVSGVTTSDNTKIELKFSKKMGLPIAGAEAYFTVKVGGQANTVKSVGLKATGSDTLVLTLNSPIASGASIKVTYAIAQITAANKILAEDKGILASTQSDAMDVTNNIPITAAVTSVSSINADGIYSTGQKVYITVSYNTPVTVAGTPIIQLDTGTTKQNAVYVMGSTTYTLTFVYTVQYGDKSSDLDYVSAAAFTLNGGSIKNTGTTIDADLTLPAISPKGALATNKAIVIDTTIPTQVLPVSLSKTDTTITLTFASDRKGSIYYIVVPKGSNTPNPTQIKTGTDGWDLPLPVNMKGMVDLTTALSGTKTISGLTPGIAYGIFSVAEDTAGNIEVTPQYIEETTNSAVDHTKPTFTVKNVTVKNNTTINLNLKTDINGKIFYVIVPDNSTSPTAVQIKAGTDVNDTLLPTTKTGSMVLPANTDVTITITGLTPSTAYAIHVTAENSNIPPDLQPDTAVYRKSFKTDVPPDTTAPSFVGIPAISSQTNNTANLGVKIDEDGKLYYIVLPKNAAAPSSAQVKLGVNAAGTVQTMKGSSNLAANTDSTVGIIGLSALTTYDIYLAAEDGYGNLQTSSTKVTITTDSIPNLIPPINQQGYPKVEGGDSFINIRIKADKTGKAYYVVLTHGKPSPTAAQVKAGKDGLNAAPVKSGNTAITANMESATMVTGLAVSTIYDVYVIVEDTANPVNLQLTPVKLNVATNPLNLTAAGIDIAGGLITGTTTGMEYSFDATSGTTGTWAVCGATNTIKVPFTFGKLYIREKANTSNFRIIADIPAPVDLALSGVTYNVANGTISGMKNNMEYSIVSGLWYPANTTSSVTNVNFVQGAINIRIKATAYTLASNYASPGYIFAPAAAPELVADDVENTITGLNNAPSSVALYEYKIGSGSWTIGTTSGDFSGTKSVQVRLKATAATLPSLVQTINFTANMDFSGVALNMATSQINGTTTGMQYSIDSTNGSNGNWKNCTTSVTNISLIYAKNVYIRSATQTGSYKQLAAGQTAPGASTYSVDLSGGQSKISITANSPNRQYSLNGGLTWIDIDSGVTVSNLDLSNAPNNDLRFRIKATTTLLASLPTDSLNSLFDLTKVTIDVSNNTINGTTIELEYSLNSTDGLTDGTWTLCSAPVTTGLNLNTNMVYVRVAAQPRNKIEFPITKQVAAPVVAFMPTATTAGRTKLIMLDPNLKYQYIIDTNATLAGNSSLWGSATTVTASSVIDDLALDPTKYIHIRIKGTPAVLPSAVTDATVQLINIKPAGAPSVTADDKASVTAHLMLGGSQVQTSDLMEYSFDGAPWTDVTSTLTLNLSGTHVLYVRLKATATAPASDSTGNLDY